MLRKGSDFSKESIKKSWGKESANERGGNADDDVDADGFSVIEVTDIDVEESDGLGTQQSDGLVNDYVDLGNANVGLGTQKIDDLGSESPS
ncbi:hypothetical protein Tco_0623097 [Tanacetum coccineum]